MSSFVSIAYDDQLATQVVVALGCLASAH